MCINVYRCLMYVCIYIYIYIYIYTYTYIMTIVMFIIIWGAESSLNMHTKACSRRSSSASPTAAADGVGTPDPNFTT